MSEIEQAMSCRGRTVVITRDGGIWLQTAEGLIRLVPIKPLPIELKGAKPQEIYLEHAAQCEQQSLFAKNPRVAEQWSLAAASWARLASAEDFGIPIIAHIGATRSTGMG